MENNIYLCLTKEINNMKRVYKSFEIKNFTILVVTQNDALVYVSVSKNMPNNMRATLGKEFKSFDEAMQAYKNLDIKNALLLIELGLVQPVKSKVA